MILAGLLVVVILVFIMRRGDPSKEARARLPLALQAHRPTDSNPSTGSSSTNAPSDTGLVEALNNMTYIFHNRNGAENVKMVNGKAATDGDSYDLGNVAIGDLNGDGKADAVAVIGESGGGSGYFEGLVAVVNNNGTITNSEMFPLGDRVKINSIEVKGQVVIVDMITHGPNDPMCCPSEHRAFRLTLAGNKLLEAKNAADRALAASHPTRYREMYIGEPAVVAPIKQSGCSTDDWYVGKALDRIGTGMSTSECIVIVTTNDARVIERIIVFTRTPFDEEYQSLVAQYGSPLPGRYKLADGDVPNSIAWQTKDGTQIAEKPDTLRERDNPRNAIPYTIIVYSSR